MEFKTPQAAHQRKYSEIGSSTANNPQDQLKKSLLF